MKKQLLTFLVFLLLAINARAQQNTIVTVGTGTVSSPDYGPLYVSPVSGGHVSQHVVIFTAAELNATPFTARTLTQIAWNKTDTSRYSKNNGVLKIYIKNTTTAGFSDPLGQGINVTNEINSSTLVYSNTTQNISSGAGWKTFTLNTPFVWNGTDNLEVIVDWSVPGVPTGTGPMQWATTPITTSISAFAADPFQANRAFIQPNRPNAQLTFTEFSNDASISAITSPGALITPGSSPVQVTIKNAGNNTLSSATIGWKVNGVAQSNVSWNGTLASGATSAPISLGSFTFPAGSSTIKAYTSNPNSAIDPLPANDTTIFKLIACNTLSGNYTINKGAAASATNFKSFTDAALVLNACGINAPVTITVAPGSGPYNETLTLKNVSGVSATNTLTFEGNGNTLTTNLVTATSAAVTIDNVKYFKLNNLVVTATSTLTGGYGIQLMNTSHNATISNCTIHMPTSSGQNFIGLLIGGPNNAGGDHSSNSLFQNNTVNNGGYSMRINGLAVTGSSPIGAVNVRVLGNNFKDFYSNGIYVSNADANKIEGNDFSRPTRTDVGNYTGIALSTGCRNTVINKNRFHNTHGAATSKTGGVIGIDVQIAAPAGSENIVKNNLLYDLNNTGPITALSASSSADGVYFYNNTISIERTVTSTSDQKGFNLGTPGANIKFINNIVTINSPGTGIKAAIYYQNFNSSTAPIAATFISNNNVFYLAPGQTNAYIGYLKTPTPIQTAATLVAWKAINTTTPYDMNSVEINPAYTNLSTGDLKPTASGVNNIGQPLTAVIDDILGVIRSTTTPDPGAYEFDVNDAGVSAITAPNSGCNLTNQEVITITVNNFGTAALSNVPVSYTINGGTAVTAIVAGPIAPGASATHAFTTTANLSAAGSYSIVASTNLAGDALATNNAFTKVVVSSTAPAVPTITANGAATFCTGDSVTLTAASTTTGATYTWSLNGTAITGATSATFTANAAGNYTATATATTGGCYATSVATAVTVNPTPATPTVTRSGFVLTSSSATGNQWYKDGVIISSATNDTYNTTANGTYTVIVTDNGCASTASNAVTITNTGMADNMATLQVAVYPNPSSGVFHITLPESKPYQFLVTDLSGKVIQQQAVKSSTVQLNMLTAAKGIYMLHITSENGSAVRKLIVE